MSEDIKEVPARGLDARTIKEKLQDFKDTLITRKLGYYKIIPSPEFESQLPESQKPAQCQCYAPADKGQHQLDTMDFGAGAIKTVMRSLPDYKGLIYDGCGNWGDTQEAMQLYANEYKQPCCTAFNGRIRIVQPQKEGPQKVMPVRHGKGIGE